MQNQFQFDEQEGVIYIIFQGDQTYATVQELRAPLEEAANKLREQGRPVLVLGDTTEMKHQDSGSRKAGVDMMTAVNFLKYALVITSPYLRLISQFIVKAKGFGNKVGHFSNAEDALTWLKSS